MQTTQPLRLHAVHQGDPQVELRCLTALPVCELASAPWTAWEAEPPRWLLLLQKSRQPQRFGGPPRPPAETPNLLDDDEFPQSPSALPSAAPFSPASSPQTQRSPQATQVKYGAVCGPHGRAACCPQAQGPKHSRPHRQCPAAVDAAFWVAGNEQTV